MTNLAFNQNVFIKSEESVSYTELKIGFIQDILENDVRRHKLKV